jgi:hypothetical protein
MKKISGLILLAVLVFQACDKPQKNTEKKALPAVKAEDLKMYKDSASIAWNKMMRNDDAKFKNMLALLDNISYIPGANEKAIKSVKAEVETLWKSRYDSTQMKAVIVDEFDSKTTEVINKIFAIAEKTKGIEKYANCTSLQQEIITADNNTLMLDRAHYDKWAKNYNELITKDNKKESNGTLPLFETLN